MAEGLNVISLWQPHASLVALKVKRIETRGWKPGEHKIGQRLLIHAARRPIPEVVKLGPWEAWPADGKGQQHPNHDGPRPARIYRNDLGWLGGGAWVPLPLGAIVASCTLANVAPIGGPMSFRTGTFEGDEGDFPGQPVLVFQPPHREHWPEELTLDHNGRVTDVSDQIPYGDFSPGRWGWLLEDIASTAEQCPACWGSGVGDYLDRITCSICDGAGTCDPIPARGRQGIWRWNPDPGASPG